MLCNEHPEGMPTALYLTDAVLTLIKETIGNRPAESGGMLGGNRATGEVTDYYFDATPREQNAVAYSPNNILLTKVLKEEWKPKGIQLLGFAHSHPTLFTRPSQADKEYAKTILEHMDLPYLLLPIIRTAVDSGAFALFPYIARRDGKDIAIEKLDLVIDRKQKSPQSMPTSPPLPEMVPWEAFALGGLGLLTCGYATLRAIQEIHRAREKEGGNNG
jgi:proteasome lid subunit RPN8/RPN11